MGIMSVKDCNFTHSVQSFPRMRNFVLDVINEGKKKNIVYTLFESNVTRVRRILRVYKYEMGSSLSFTAYIIRCLAKAVDEQKHMHAYRQGKKKLIVFDSVDMAVIIEREVDGWMQPVNFILRDANNKSFREIHTELRAAKTEPLGQDKALSKIDKIFFRMPRWVRTIFWSFRRKNPFLQKRFAGTVGVTSIGMHGSGVCYGLPLTPMTLTLIIGTIDSRLHQEILCMTLAADHEIIDGVPLTKFMMRLKELVETGFELDEIEREIEQAIEQRREQRNEN